MLTSKLELRLVYKVSTCLGPTAQIPSSSQQNMCPRVLLSPCTIPLRAARPKNKPCCSGFECELIRSELRMIE